MSNFPLPEGYSRNVYRPNRKADRVIGEREVVRMLRAALKNGYDLQEICEAIATAGMGCKKPNCDRLKKLVDDYLDAFQDMKEHVGLLDEFFNDLWPF